MGAQYTAVDDHIIRKHAGKLSAADIGRLLGRTRGAVCQRALCIGVSLKLTGERHHRAKYADATVAAARQHYRQGKRPKWIAERTGLPVRYVRRLCYGDIRQPAVRA